MLDVASSTGFVEYEKFNLNVTSRNDTPENYDQFVSMIEFTLRLWVYVAKHIQEGKRICQKTESAQELAGHGPEYGLPYCTVWGDVIFRNGLTVHTHTKPQDALDAFWARYDALERLGIINAQPSVTAGNGDTKNGYDSDTAQLGDGIIIGKMNPSSTKVYYENGQVVALPVKKIALAYLGGWYYEFWTGLGNNKYPGVKVFKTKKNSDENSDAYKAIKDVIEGLQLDPDKKKSVEGDWWILGNINHTEKDGTTKEYFNVIGIRAK